MFSLEKISALEQKMKGNSVVILNSMFFKWVNICILCYGKDGNNSL